MAVYEAIATFIATRLQPSKTHDLQSLKAGHSGNRLPLYYFQKLSNFKVVKVFKDHPVVYRRLIGSPSYRKFKT